MKKKNGCQKCSLKMWIHPIHGHLCREKFCWWHCSSAAKNQGALCRGPRSSPLTRGPDSSFSSATKTLGTALPRTLNLQSWGMAGKADAIDGELSVDGIYHTWSSSTEPVNLSPLPPPLVRLAFSWSENAQTEIWMGPVQRTMPLQKQLRPTPSRPPWAPIPPAQTPSPILCWRGKYKVWASPWKGPAGPHHQDARDGHPGSIHTHHAHPSNDQNGTKWVLKSYSWTKTAQKPLITNGIVSLREKTVLHWNSCSYRTVYIP